jgi:hypothetical protein
MKKVKVKEEIIEVPGYFKVIENRLYNNNAKKYEGVDGDIVTVKEGNSTKTGHVKGYTDFQVIPTYEWPTMIVSAQGLREGTSTIDFIHKTPVYNVYLTIS